MMIPMFAVLMIAVFVTQLTFCLYAKKRWIKLLPLCCIGSLIGICWLTYGLGVFSDIYGAAFAAYIYGIVSLAAAAACVLAWGVYGIARTYKKRRDASRPA